MRRWPDTLPTPSMPGFGLSPVDQARRTDMETGAPRVRRVTFARNDHVDVQFIFTDAEMAAFRAWWGDEAWSLAGDSDSLTGWALTGATVTADALVGPDDALADRIVEDGSTGQHRAQRALDPGALDGSTILGRATMRAAGRSQVRLGLLDRSGTLCWAGVNLATGAIGGQSGLTGCTVEDRGNGWWRVTILAPAGAGASDPVLRIAALQDAATLSYVGAGSAALAVCEMQARVVTGFDLFVRTDAAGNALGAAGGAAWVIMPVAVGGGFRFVDARFKGPFKATAGAGLNWDVSASMEVRNG
ncbi:hypothetical protein RNZ50_15640 [Paracoccaceae bacterium Fryx2]|nr:hypothetical protein [Paracoccaceae bacterium Fryx2]